jgi:UDP-3-O-[3-hydroxymyristoyl] glucosamine N-acyltransferase
VNFEHSFDQNGFKPRFSLTLAKIAKIVEGEIAGDSNTLITGISGIKEAQPGDITFVANKKYLPLMRTTRASAIITSYEINGSDKPLVKTDNPSLAFAKLVSCFALPEEKSEPGIHPTAVIGKDVKIGRDVSIKPYAVVSDGVKIGDNTIISANVFVGKYTIIGEKTLIYPHVVIRERITIGSRVIIHSGTIIGSDGFGFATVKGVHRKIPQVGTVVIGDDVEIGANVTIDRARFGKTHIKQGTKIDNLVQIAHNVEIGENSIIVAQSGISGSTVVGRGVILAGQSGIVGHITIGDNAIVAAQAGVTKSVPANERVSGYPARSHSIAKRINACVQRLPKLYKRFHELEEKIRNLEEELEYYKSKKL